MITNILLVSCAGTGAGADDGNGTGDGDGAGAVFFFCETDLMDGY